ncbi:MAG: hypothetical protein AAGE43_11870 [Pseudomonadota bacterium]
MTMDPLKKPAAHRLAISVPLAIYVTLLTACGGGGGGDEGGGVQNTPPPPPPPPATTSGVFKDANVAGLAYSSGALSGITNGSGAFECETGSTIAFSVGSVDLGATACATLVMPQALAGTGALDDVETLNRARFLLMLDFDGDPDNGIEISDAVQQIADSWVQPNFSTADLDTELASIVSDAFSVDQTMHDLPDAATALAHLEATAACAYGGAFAGRMAGDLTGAFGVVIGFPGIGNAPFAPSSAGWVAFDGLEEFVAGGGGANSITYAARPVIDHSGPNLAGPFDGNFDTPDRITGNWESAGNNVSGTYSVDRIGGDDGTWRFVGDIVGAELSGVVALALTGNQIAGEVFEVFEGITYQVTGSITGDSVTLTATGGAQPIDASGTVVRSGVGEPIALTANFSGGSLSAAACRLN